MGEPLLDAGESVITSFRANRTQGGRAVGGRLFLTSSHLRFQPHGLDRVTGGKAWAVERAAVSDVDVAPRSGLEGPFAGGARKRLRVHLSNDDPELFVVNDVDEKVHELHRELGLGCG
jgi:hypothetical protein